jgi:hypothetical protein
LKKSGLLARLLHHCRSAHALLRDTLAIMGHRQLALRSKIGELIALLETIRSYRIQSMVVHIDTNEARTYSVDGLRDALSSLASEVNSSSEATINAVEEKYEHDRADVLRIVGRLAEIVSNTASGDEYGPVSKQFSTF